MFALPLLQVFKYVMRIDIDIVDTDIDIDNDIVVLFIDMQTVLQSSSKEYIFLKYLIEFDDIWMIQHFKNLYFSINFLQIFTVKSCLINDFYGNLSNYIVILIISC